MKILVSSFWIIGVLVFLNLSCKKEKAENTTPILTTHDPVEITSNSAVSGGEILTDGGEFVNARGVCWSLNQSPTTGDFKTINGTGAGEFHNKLSNLTPNTSFYVRSYATNSIGTSYGLQKSFRTDIPVSYAGEGVTDIEGNFYLTVIIGDQEWFAENLRTTALNDGASILYAPDDEDWEEQSQPAYCWYDNDIIHASTYGALYNWNVIHTNKLCPVGWRVPKDEDWKILESSIDSEYGYLHPEWNNEGDRGYDAGAKLKSTSGWDYYGNGVNGIDLFGFNALPAGFRASCCFFTGINGTTQWWLAENDSDYRAWRRIVKHNESYVSRTTSSIYSGYSVRCVRDVE